MLNSKIKVIFMSFFHIFRDFCRSLFIIARYINTRKFENVLMKLLQNLQKIKFL